MDSFYNSTFASAAGGAGITWNPIAQANQPAMQYNSTLTPSFSVTTPAILSTDTVVVFYASSGTSATYGITFDGNPMTVETLNGSTSIWTLTGVAFAAGSHTIVAAVTGTNTVVGIQVGIMKGNTSTTPTANGTRGYDGAALNVCALTNGTSPPGPLTIPSGGIGLYLGYAFKNCTYTSPTNLTVDSDLTFNATSQGEMVIGHSPSGFSGSWNPSISNFTPGSDGNVCCCAVFH